MRNIITTILLMSVVTAASCQSTTVSDRLALRVFPSIFQAWNPIDMKEVSLATPEQRLTAGAKHDILWEEPVSQLGYGVDLVLGTIWDNKFQGLADDFTPETKKNALGNRRKLLEMNPDMILLMEIRWKDAPGRYLPEDSEWWLRDENGNRKIGWTGGPEPYYYLDYRNPSFGENVRKQASVAVASGIYDGVMLDWWGSHGESDPVCIEFLKKIREAIGPDGIIIVNNDRISPLPVSAPYINGAFMEMKYDTHHTPEGWKRLADDLVWFEQNLRKPVLNCLNIQAGDMQEMMAGLAVSLIFSNGNYLFGRDDNSNPAPDHLHHWFKAYDIKLGKPSANAVESPDGLFTRKFENGVVVYNPWGNGERVVRFGTKMKLSDTGKPSTEFVLEDRNGYIFTYE
jgi:hypothetical protein